MVFQAKISNFMEFGPEIAQRNGAEVYITTLLASSLDHTFLDWTTLWGCLWGLADLADGWVRKGGPIYWIIGMKVTSSGISPQVDRFGA